MAAILSPLDEAETSIRLCKAESDLQNNTVTCTVWTENLLTAENTYSAISYTWRSPLPNTLEETTHTISCNGHDIQVHFNLFQALLRLGQSPGTPLWIDKICIDHDNLTEKGSQINLMADIYKGAKEVLVWLGPDDDHLESAIKLIRTLCDVNRKSKQSLFQITSSNLQSEAVRALLPPELTQKKAWVSLAQFFRRSWFRRAWVVQEVLMARVGAVRVLCGRCPPLDWSDLETMSDFLTRTEWRLRFSDPTYLGFSEHMPNFSSPSALGAAKSDLSGESPLLRCLIRTRAHECLYPIDKVFCLYGIARHFSPHGVAVPAANYKLSVGQAYTEAAANVLQSSSNLHILAYAEGPDFRRCDPNLPSWAPDWSVQDLIGIGVVGHNRYWAAGDLPKSWLDFPYANILRLQAAHVADITLCGESKRRVMETGQLFGWLTLIDSLGPTYFTGRRTLNAFWRTLLYDTGDDRVCPARAAIGASFFPWLQRNVSDTGLSSAGMAKLIAAAASENDPSQEPDQRSSAGHRSSDSPGPSLFEFNFGFRTHLRPFITGNRLLGLGSECVQPGDSVWIVPGSRIPLILRKKDNPTTPGTPEIYALIGGSYLHGLMHGEAVEQGVPTASGVTPLHFQTIDIA